MKKLAGTLLFALQLLITSTAFAELNHQTLAQKPLLHDRNFWRSVVKHNFKLPEGTELITAAIELAAYVDELDPELRDQFGYEIQRHFLHDSDVLAAHDLNVLHDTYLPYVLQSLGEQGTKSVFARSFALLNLKELAAVDLTRPFLTQARFDDLFGKAEQVLRFEKDLRGYDERNGWAHATAHAADLMRVLARNPKLSRAQQSRLISAIAQRARSTAAVFTWGEDARLAAALMMVLHRPDFDSDAFEIWFSALRSEHKALWQGKFNRHNYVHVRTQANVLTQLAAIIARNDPSDLPEKIDTALGNILAEVN